MWIKICANTNLEDAQLAVQLGADAVGFVFAPSKRHVTAEQVASITPHLPADVERVGVFQNHTASQIAAIVEQANLTAAQLHDSNPNLARQLREILPPRIKIIQTIHWSVDPGTSSAEQARQRLQQIVATQTAPSLVLIDSKAGQKSGGSGISFDWAEARAVFAEFAGRVHIIAAGGLRPENVATAIRELNPWGVDVASGVEALPGQKDPLRLSEFIGISRRTT